jgi:hypothetical protein
VRTEITSHALLAWAEVACAVAFAPLVLGWLPAVGGRRRSATDLYLQAFVYCMVLMPLVTAACAWFATWRLGAKPPKRTPQSVRAGLRG